MSKSKRGRKRSIKLKIKPGALTSIFSVLLVILAGLSFISFFAPDYSLNQNIQSVLRGAFGFSSILIPPILAIWGMLYIKSLKLPFVEVRILFGLIGALVSLAGLFHIFYSPDNALNMAQEGVGGGIVGYQLAQLLSNTVSKYGGFLVLLGTLMVSAIFLFDLSFDEFFGRVNELREKLSFRKSGSSYAEKKHSEMDVHISSGLDLGLDNEDAEDNEPAHHSTKKKHFEAEPVIEVIPTMAEPQNVPAMADMPKGKGAGFNSLSQPGLPYSDKVWELPPLELLQESSNAPIDRGDVKARAKIIEDTLRSFGVVVRVRDIDYGPTVTRYALEADSGTKITKISSLQYDLALSLASPTGSVRIEAPIPGKSLIGIEVPNNTRVPVSFKDVFVSDAMRGVKSKLGIVLGKDVGGQTLVYDIGKMPHLLVAGATGSGKSVFLHSLMFSLLYRCSPNECKFILVDPKRVELIHYGDIPHLYTPVVTDIEKAASVFKWAVAEMERRYKLFESAKARNIESYNEKSGFQALPYIMIIVDELGEIMVADPASVEKSIIRIAQLARATGIHLVLTTQRPSTNVVTGLIKANIPCRIAFNVTSNIDSRVIIDQPGAEKLMGKGDMLFVPPDVSKPVRVQGAMVTDAEIAKLVNYLKSFGVGPDYAADILTQGPEKDKSISAGGDSTDDLFNEAVEIVVSANKASASLLQRRLSVGYARAARILDELEAKNIIGPAKGSKPREILVPGGASGPIDDITSDEDYAEEVF